MPCCSSAPLFAWYDVGDFWKWGNLNDGGDSSAVRNQLMKTSPAPPTWRCHLYDPRNTSHNAAHQTFFFYRCWKCPPPSFLQRFPKTKRTGRTRARRYKKNMDNAQEQQLSRPSNALRGEALRSPPAPPTRLFFRPFPCCLDNDTKQAEPQPQPLSQQQQETCRGIVLTFAPLRNNNTNKKKKKAQKDKKKQEETRRR